MKPNSARPPHRVIVTLDTWLSVAAVVTSVCALTITIYQAYLQRKQQHASVMPVLDVYLSNGDIDRDGQYNFDFVLVNNGIGPAFIRQFEYWYLGQKKRTFNEMIDAEVQASRITNLPNEMYCSNLWSGRILPQNQEVKLISINGDTLARKMYEHNGQIHLKIWYQSIYGETWLFDTNPKQPEDRLVKVE